MADQNFDRFRSFAERYIISRAGSFRTGFEREDAWQATLDAKTIYANVARMSIDAEPLELEIAKMASQSRNGAGNLTQVGSSVTYPGVTGLGPPPSQRKPQGPSVVGSPLPGPSSSWLQRIIRKESANGTP